MKPHHEASAKKGERIGTSTIPAEVGGISLTDSGRGYVQRQTDRNELAHLPVDQNEFD